MKKFIYLNLIIALFLFFTIPDNLFANFKESGKDNGKKPRLQKTLTNPSQSLININNATMWVTEEGFHDWVVASGWNGAFPNGKPIGAIFAEGIVWGGFVSDGASPVVRVDGNTYGTGCAPITRLYRVRPDYLTGNLTSDAATYNDIPIGAVTEPDIQAIRDQYATDWNEWPASEGAPFKDVNNNGTYEPDVDIPGIPGASQTLFIKYNDNLSAANYGSPPIGMEVSETYWAYSYSGALGNVIYKKVDMVYKGTPTSASNSRIDSMYIVQWADPDVGTSSDDFAGCDTTLNLGYAYSSSADDGAYDGYNLAPPAVGYDFLQGVSKFTGNPNDSAIFNLQWRKGYKYINSKPMSSFVYFAAGGGWSDADFNYNGTLQFYNLMRGNKSRPPYPTYAPFPVDVADVTADGTFLLAGDPVTGTGKIDGSYEGPGDRRIMVTNGPISMSLGDTAEVVLALVYSSSVSKAEGNNLTSIASLKKNDLTAQIVFDQLFKLPNIDPPNVSVANLNNKVVLSWGADVSNLNSIENFSDQNYTFEGYEVYQLPTSSSSLSDGILLGTFDAVNGVQAIYDTAIVNGTAIPELAADGKDKGIQRYFTIVDDKVRGTALRNGQEYYFAVVSYAYNPVPLLPFHVLRSAFVIQTTVPQTTLPGVRLSSSVGDSLSVVHSAGVSDGSVAAIVVDPTQVTGHNYEVTFRDTAGAIVWDLTDVSMTPPVVKASNQTNQGGGDDYPIVDGLVVKAIGPPVAGKSYSYESAVPSNISPIALQAYTDYTGGRWITGGHEGEIFFGGVYLEPNFWGETSLKAGEHKPVVIKFRPMASYTDLNGNGAYDIGEPYVVDDPNQTQKAFMYQTFSPGSYLGFFDLPFTVWDISDPANPRQLNVVVRDRDQNHQWDLNHLTDPPDPLLPNGGDQQFNYTWILNTTYDPTGTMYGDGTGGSIDFWSFDGGNGVWDGMWVMWLNDRDNGGMLAEESSLTLIPNAVNLASDKFTFSSTPNSSSQDLAKEDVGKINVFPNPYYGFQSRETSPDNKYVTFSHLPDNAVIRIFDISGVLVKTINHISTSGQFDVWDLQNDNNYPVASGIYIVYIDMPGLGTTKILKLAVIQEQQILKVY